jgi:DNA-binding response OmpR family regulator
MSLARQAIVRAEGPRLVPAPRRCLLLVTDRVEAERWLSSAPLPGGLEVTAVLPDQHQRLEELQPSVILVDLIGRWPQVVDLCQTWLAARGDRPMPLVGLVPADHVSELEPHWGLDDFLVYPGSTTELSVRLRVLLYRFEPAGPLNGLRLGDLSIDFDRYEVTLRSESLYLTFKEYELLKFLVTHPDRVFTREALLTQVWGYDYFGGTRTVDVHIRRLREKLGPRYGDLIQTVRQVGYRFVRQLR